MIEEKKRKLERKKAKKIKEIEKQGMFNLNALRREIYAYQLRLIRQPTWNRSFVPRAERFGMRIKGQGNATLEVKG